MKTNIFIIILILLCSCNSQKPIATAHIERIEERVKPIAIGADTIEITLSHTDNYRLTECTENTEPTVFEPLAIKFDFPLCEKSCKNVSSAGVATASSVNSVNSVRDKNSVRNKNSVRVKSTRGVSIQRTKTDTTQTLRITLRPDTVYVPNTHHIRSDTIVVQDKICKQKLTQSKTINIFLLIILILLVATIICRKLSR